MTQAERVPDYLCSVAPNGAKNGELARMLEIRSHQTVYMHTAANAPGPNSRLAIMNNLGVPCRRGTRHSTWYWTCTDERHNAGHSL
jgi:hypothetical protein